MGELAALRQCLLDLAERVRRACADKLATLTEDGKIGELPAVPTPSDSIELPPLPALSDPLAVEARRDAIAQMSQERGEQRFREGEEQGRQDALREGEERGLREGEARGRQDGLRECEARARVRALLVVLQRRGIALAVAQVERLAYLAPTPDAYAARTEPMLKQRTFDLSRPGHIGLSRNGKHDPTANTVAPLRMPAGICPSVYLARSRPCRSRSAAWTDRDM